MMNTDTRYGPVTKALHWVLFLLLLNQFAVAAAMLNTPDWDTTAGFTQGALYEWHKSIGLVALAAASVRYLWRRTTPLPDWAPNLSTVEKRTIHAVERALYTCMFLMPVSGFVFVMAGGFGVVLFGRWDLPNVIGKHPALARTAELTHEASAVLLALALVAHWVVILRHHRVHKDRYVHRMLPFTHQQ
jgi:cytochrome b561